MSGQGRQHSYKRYCTLQLHFNLSIVHLQVIRAQHIIIIIMSDPKSMGDAFMQRRAAVAAAGKNDRKSSTSSSTTAAATTTTTAGGAESHRLNNNTNNMSMADIQREQLQQRDQLQRQQQQLQQRPQLQQHHHPVDEYGRLRTQPGGRSNRDSTASASAFASDTDQNYRRGVSKSSSSGGGNGTQYSSSRGVGGRRGSTTNSNIQNLPVEHGIIHSLLDKFGFILCADRDRELFFHYSEYNNTNKSGGGSGGNISHSDELNIGDEVEFRVGVAPPPRGGGDGGEEGNEKMSAYDVRRLPPGTIYWETEDEPKGKRRMGVVDKVAAVGTSIRRRRGEDVRGSSGGGGCPISSFGSVGAGLIRIIGENCDDAENKESKPLEVYYNSVDVIQTPNQQRRPRRPQLERGDMVEVTLVTERRTKEKYAREICLIRSERERRREEEESRLLENATLETGVVVSTKGDFGFLRSTIRVEEVYFHTSNIIMSMESDSDGGGVHIGEGDGNAGSNVTLMEGQEVEFYVVDEAKVSSESDICDDGGGRVSGGGKMGGSTKSLSARKIKILPNGTVKFEHIIAQGISGLVTECPVNKVTESFGRSERAGSELQNVVGKIRLQEDVVDNDGQSITEVFLCPEMYPGRTFVISRTGGELGTWIRPGDRLMFDVVKKVVDGTCHAVPTKFVHRASLRPEGCSTSSDSTTNIPPSIRFIEPSLCGRTEGVVRSIHDNYGFIQLVERNVNAYFPLYEVFPAEILADLVRNNPDIYSEGDDLIQQKGGRISVEVGMEVAFDLSLQMLTSLNGGGRDGGIRFKQSRPVQDKQSLRARRIQILPRGTVRENVTIASKVQATVTKADAKQLFAGMLELDESVKIVSVANLRHPLVAKLIDSISNGRFDTENVTFHDVLSEADSQIVTSMVNASDDLEWSYIVPDNSSVEVHNRRICITRKNLVCDDNSDVYHNEIITPCDDADVAPANEVKAIEEETDGEGIGDGNTTKTEMKQNSLRNTKVVESVRYDKISFPDMSDGPPSVGDVVTCDLYLSRRSGTVNVENIMIVERNSPKGAEHTVKRTSSLSGFVSEVVPSRQFGFITAVDEHGTKTGEHIFFHYKEVDSCGKSDVISKGDEVMFDSRPGKNGKLNAANISILPRGTLKQGKEDSSSSSCTGYILIEPSRTLLMNTPSHTVLQSTGGKTAGVGRWNVREEPVAATTNKVGSSMKGEGVILLLTDPSNQFSSKPNLNTPTTVVTSESSDITTGSEFDAYVSSEAGNTSVSADVEGGDENSPSSNMPVVGTHIVYKFSSLASRFHSTYVNTGRPDGPKRGDLVSFSRARGSQLVKDIRIAEQGAATRITGTLISVNKDADSAIFVSTERGMKYDINLTEVVSCYKALINENEKVEGILYDGKIFGVCRIRDIHLSSSFGSSGGLSERPKLNLNVKKELQGMGGQIMAQSRMAKGPDGTDGFILGWTNRVSVYVMKEENTCSPLNISLSASASDFVPIFAIATSGLESEETE